MKDRKIRSIALGVHWMASHFIKISILLRCEKCFELNTVQGNNAENTISDYRAIKRKN